MGTSMKRYSIRIYIGQLALLSALSAGWWGILYPEFGLSAETFAVVEEQPEKESDPPKAQTPESEKKLSGSEAFLALLEAEPGQVRIRSRFLEEVFHISRGKENEQQCAHRDF